MFISKKRFEREIEKAKCEVSKLYEEERCREQDRRWTGERMGEMEREIRRLGEELREMRGIKEKYDKICEIANTRPVNGAF